METIPTSAKAYTNLQDCLDDYSRLNDNMYLFIRQVTTRAPLANRQDWESLAEHFCSKMYLSSCSLADLAEGTVIGRNISPGQKPLDLSSIYTLARAELEAYLTFCYLFIQPGSEAERELRIAMYKLQSLTIRINLPKVQEISHFNKWDEDQIKSIHKILSNNSIFIKYPKDKKASILSGRYAKSKGWESILKDSKLHAKSIQISYNTYANHAHSEFISMIQLREVIDNPAQISKMVTHTLTQSLCMLSVFLREIAVLFKATDIYNSFPNQAKVMLKLWSAAITDKHEFTDKIDL